MVPPADSKHTRRLAELVFRPGTDVVRAHLTGTLGRPPLPVGEDRPRGGQIGFRSGDREVLLVRRVTKPCSAIEAGPVAARRAVVLIEKNALAFLVPK
jgi:hypothetical protein